MAKEVTKQEAQRLMKIEGECRGAVFKSDSQFVLKQKGKEALEQVEKKLEDLGFPLKYEGIRSMNFYPIGQRILSLLVIKKVLGLSKQEIKQMGALAPKGSLIIKLFLRYFVSLQRVVKQVNNMWEKHYTAGRMSAETHEEEKYLILRLEDFELHPIFCTYLEGYLATLVQLVVKSPVESEETKCTFENNKYHEFLLKWQ